MFIAPDPHDRIPSQIRTPNRAIDFTSLGPVNVFVFSTS